MISIYLWPYPSHPSSYHRSCDINCRAVNIVDNREVREEDLGPHQRMVEEKDGDLAGLLVGALRKVKKFNIVVILCH